MINIPGYYIQNQIYKSAKTVVYKAERLSDNKFVMIKILRKEYPSPEELRKIKHEYIIIKSLEKAKGVVNCYDLINYKNSLAIVIEYVNGQSLNEFIYKKIINLKIFLEIAIKLVDIIEEIHEAYIIHKDIKPANIIINEYTMDLKIIDFSISSQLIQKKQDFLNPERLEGTLAYISPEQTGRINRSIDYKSDYYSLGVTFFEMLTKKLPFESNNPMELVHQHIAKEPEIPHKINKNIPVVLSNIILKLLAKNASSRYQSTAGIKHDLTECYNQLTQKGSISNFKIAAKDISSKFFIPEKLYGRNEEFDHLKKLYDKVAAGNKKIIFLHGPPGIGKSFLINEIQGYLAKKKAYFISGKFDLLKKYVPYFAIIQAFQVLIKQILTEEKEKITAWKDKILSSVGINGQVLTNVIPEIELIIGKQPEMEQLLPIEAQNRFTYVFKKFIKIFAIQEQPLILFIDDMQWADNASINLITALLNDNEIQYLFFIGTYRDKNSDSELSLNLLFNQLDRDIEYENMQLYPLDEKHVTSLLSDVFKIKKAKTIELAKLIINKTNGNPFFIAEFLKTLYNNQLIKFNKSWTWDIIKIKEAKITDNVVSLMTDKIKGFKGSALYIMKIAACIGVKFDIDLLSMVSKKDKDEVFQALKTPINEGMIIISPEEKQAKFVHDKVREAIYLIINNEEKNQLHYLIGIKLSLDKIHYKDNIFTICNQLNIVKKLLNDEEKYNLTIFNYEAGIKAKSAAAYELSCEYFTQAIQLLTKESWEKKYKITLEIYTEYAEVMSILKNSEKIEDIFTEILTYIKSLEDKIRIYKIKILYYTKIMEFNNAINSGIELINELGFFFPKLNNINTFTILFEIIKTNNIFNKKLKEVKSKNFIDLVNLEQSSNKIVEFVVSIILDFSTAVFSNYPDKLPYVLFRMANLSINYGINPLTSSGIIGLAMTYSSAFKNYKAGYELGKLAIKLVNKYNNKQTSPLIYFHMGNHISHWKESIKLSIEYLNKAYTTALETGNYQWASFTLTHSLKSYFLSGLNLQIIKNQLDKTKETFQKFNQTVDYPIYFSFMQMIYNLIVPDNNKTRLIGEFFNENIIIHQLQKYNKSVYISFIYTYKLFLNFIFSNYEQSLDIIEKGEKHENSVTGQLQNVFYSLFKGITYLKMYNKLSRKKKKKYLNEAIKINKLLLKLSENCPDNFIHMYYLLKAEIARVNKNDSNAIKFYNQAIDSAKKYNLLHIEAIANELAAEYYKEIGVLKVFQTYMIEASYCYVKWGAQAKVMELEKKYPEIFEYLFNMENTTGDMFTRIYSTISHNDTKLKFNNSFLHTSLDIDTILKASRVIAAEIKIESLISKLIIIIHENSGAQKSILLMNKDDKLTIEAKITIDNDQPELLKSVSIDDSNDIAKSIINYVNRTKEFILINDAANENIFKDDPYIIQNKPKSILCIPILHQNYLIGVLYLENDATTGAFTREHTEVLRILAGQAAISIINIFLYENIKDQELLKKEMRIASNIQMSMLPSNHPEIKGYSIHGICKMAKEAGGDLYDIIKINDNEYFLLIGDVSGKGMPAALYMSSTINIIRTLVETNKSCQANSKISPGEMIKTINKILNEIMSKGKFVTILLGILDIKNNIFTYTSAGHDPGICINPVTKNKQLIKTKGQACGQILPEIYNNNIEQKKIKVNNGDFFIFHSDGITEAVNSNNEMFINQYYKKIDKINESFTAENVINYLISEVNHFTENNPQFDDITLLCFKRK